MKCDEGRPTCARCKKGGRECVYPDAAPTSKSSNPGTAKVGQASTQDPTGSSSEDSEDDEGDLSDSVPSKSYLDDNELRPSAPESLREQKSQSHLSLDTPPSLVTDKGLSPTSSTEGSTGYNVHTITADTQTRNQYQLSSSPNRITARWPSLPQDIKFYLHYFVNNVTPYHYSSKVDASNFLHTGYLEEAFKHDALLHAVVGFSAFQYTLHNVDGKIQDFLQYYNKAVSLLLRSLRKGESRNMGTLLAILQLATIEEFLGDWVNLLGHQRAAYSILTQMFTPKTVMQTETSRIMFAWYCRFDLHAGFMAGFETVLTRDWFTAPVDYFAKRIQQEPDNLALRIDASIAAIRLMAMEVSVLSAKMGKGELSLETYLAEKERLDRTIADWDTNLDPKLKDPRYLITDFSNARPLDPDDFVDPYEAGLLYQGPLFIMNITRLDWMSVDMMHKYATTQILQTQPTPELRKVACSVAQMFEAVEYCPMSPKGSVLSNQAILGMLALLLPRDDRHMMWVRRKLATVECNGYIYSLTFRSKLSAYFQDPSCMRWWLPNDENFPPIIQTIHDFVSERTAGAKDKSTEDLRDMKAIFSTLNLDEGSPPVSSSQTSGRDAQSISETSKSWSQSPPEARLNTTKVDEQRQQMAFLPDVDDNDSQYLQMDDD